MTVLAIQLRNKLQGVVTAAREVAEAGASAALEAMAVHYHEPYPHMKPAQRELRNQLRARARQLGDRKSPKADSRGKDHEINHLVAECAYEHWHQMLFARFLAENDLLIDPQEDMVISLADAADFAKTEGVDVWTFASRCAQRMLPQIFRPSDPMLQVSFANEHRLKLEELLASLPQPVFTASDALGWVYQFWQTKKKDEIHDSEIKIGSDEIPAVTQLFTESYMVEFLLQNTLGAWWAGKKLKAEGEAFKKKWEACQTEADCRQLLALPGVAWDYLRFSKFGELPKSETAGFRLASTAFFPAAGVFGAWPDAAAGLRVLDPCCGSGHFLVAALRYIVPIRMAEDNLAQASAVDAVLRDNLFGLEIDNRCCQIAAFALAFEAWKMAGYRAVRTTVLHIACSGLAPNATKEDWRDAAGRGRDAERHRAGMDRLYELFRQAPILGSLIEPQTLRGDFSAAGFHDLSVILEKVLGQESARERETAELAVAAQGMAKAAEILCGSYHLITTNVPYLGRGDQCEALKAHLESHYPDSKTDLATAFLERTIKQIASDCSVAVVVPRIWLTYTAYYRALRRKLLSSVKWDLLASLGKRAFRGVSGEVVDVVLFILTKSQCADARFAIIDASHGSGPDEKTKALLKEGVAYRDQAMCLANPGHVALYERRDESGEGRRHLLKDSVTICEGISRGDSSRFDRCFWELESLDLSRWQPLITSSTREACYGGCSYVFLWDSGNGAVAGHRSARIQGRAAWGRPGVFVSRTHLNACLTNGAAHAQNGVAIVPKKAADLLAVWCFCSSEEYRSEVLRLSQKLIKPTGVMAEVPFEVNRWRQAAAKQYPTGLPKPRSDDPSQWLFSGHPKRSESPLHVGVARLLGYRWPRQRGSTFRGCPAVPEDDLGSFEVKEGVVCISPTRGEDSASDRLRALLSNALSGQWSPRKETDLVAATGSRADSLDDWLRSDFFEQHCAAFQQRPFILHIWDGRKRDGFHALVNYHKLVEGDGRGRQLLETVTFSYLGDWIVRQRDGVKRGTGGAEDRLAAALELQKRLRAILEGEPPFDLFVRWKPLSRQPIGWEPDVNDGVRANIRPFMASDIPGGRSGAGILRCAPGIRWGRDPGSEPMCLKEDFPWYWAWDGVKEDFTGGRTFDGVRWNGCHFSCEAKRRSANR